MDDRDRRDRVGKSAIVGQSPPSPDTRLDIVPPLSKPLPRRPRRLTSFRCLAVLASACCLAAACGAPDVRQPVAAWALAAPGGADRDHLISPDGNRLAWSGTSWFRRKLFVRNLATGETRSWRVNGAVAWSANSRWLVYAADTSGTENPHVFALDTDSSASPVDLTPYPGVRAVIHQIVDSDPRNILVAHNRRNPKLFDLYRINLETRAETLVAANPGNAVAPITRADGSLQGWQPSGTAVRPAPERMRPQVERAPAIAARNEDNVRIIGPASGGQAVWALSNRGRDRSALVAFDTGRGWERVFFEDPVSDVTHAYIGRSTREPLAVVAQPGYPRVEIPDAALRAALAPVIAPLEGSPWGLHIGSGDHQDDRLVVNLNTSTQNRTWLVSRKTGSAELLAQALPARLESTLSPMRAVSFAARDGLALHAYLTLPRDATADLPMVLMVHGGPWQRNAWADPSRSEESARAQFLASRGYAVLQVDFRGSSGYGKAFQQAGIGEFGRRMRDDLLDAAAWAIRDGVARRGAIAVMGFSYGGYAALNAMADAPDTFACGISIAGPTDLASLVEAFPPYWKVDLSLWHDYVGDPGVPADRAEMTRRSPLHQARGFARPVLLIHGDRDVRVRFDQSERMERALRAAGREARLVRIPGMGHSSGWWAHQYRILRESETFLAPCLGGPARRFEWPDPLVAAWLRISG
jgi:dipeptidyl aminopeptidase/acylaminoacyl peptidase